MSTISYKGFQASVEYEDGKLFVKVLHIDDLLVAQCDSAAEVDAALKDLVDSYLEDCAELGREPTKPFKGSFNVRTSPELHRRVVMNATECGKTLNAWIGEAIREKLECTRLTNRIDDVFTATRFEVRMIQNLMREELQDTMVRRAHHHTTLRKVDWENDAFPSEERDVARLLSTRERLHA